MAQNKKTQKLTKKQKEKNEAAVKSFSEEIQDAYAKFEFFESVASHKEERLLRIRSAFDAMLLGSKSHTIINGAALLAIPAFADLYKISSQDSQTIALFFIAGLALSLISILVASISEETGGLSAYEQTIERLVQNITPVINKYEKLLTPDGKKTYKHAKKGLNSTQSDRIIKKDLNLLNIQGFLKIFCLILIGLSLIAFISGCLYTISQSKIISGQEKTTITSMPRP